jgi:hypothetical protein
MARKTPNETAIEAIKNQFQRSSDHIAQTRKSIFDIEVLKIKFKNNEEENTRYVALLKGREEVFSNIPEFIDFINLNTDELGLAKQGLLQLIFDNTAHVLALLITLSFVILLIWLRDEKLIEILKYVLGLIFGYFFAVQKQKKGQQ